METTTNQHMQIIEIEVEEALLACIDEAVAELKVSRNVFITKALHGAIYKYTIKVKETQHEAGYMRFPITEDEFSGLQELQTWEDEQK